MFHVSFEIEPINESGKQSQVCGRRIFRDPSGRRCVLVDSLASMAGRHFMVSSSGLADGFTLRLSHPRHGSAGVRQHLHIVRSR